ncbi:MAG: translesion DNA synthesis-associated protein ImuA [Gammaproteobacteria bacterium]
MSETLQALLGDSRVWRARSGGRTWRALPSGHARLDAVLPGGGWPAAMLTEIGLDRCGSGELALLMPLLERLCRPPAEAADAQGPGQGGWLAWVAPPHVPYAPALAASGVDISRVLVVRTGRDDETLWAAEQGLVSGTCSIVLAWAARAGSRQLRRLQLGAERSGTPVMLFRPSDALDQPSPAALRLKLICGHCGIRLHLVKHRGGAPRVLPGDAFLPA